MKQKDNFKRMTSSGFLGEPQTLSKYIWLFTYQTWSSQLGDFDSSIKIDFL